MCQHPEIDVHDEGCALSEASDAVVHFCHHRGTQQRQCTRGCKGPAKRELLQPVLGEHGLTRRVGCGAWATRAKTPASRN